MNDVLTVRVADTDTFVGFRSTHQRAVRVIFLDQTRYIKRLLVKYGFEDAHTVQFPAPLNVRLSLHMDHDASTTLPITFPYKSLLGSTTSPLLGTRLDISFAIANAARFAHH